MAQRCRVCTHPKRDEINRQLLQMGLSDGAVAAAFGLAKASVNRHRNAHLKVSPQAVSEQKNAKTIIGYAVTLYERAEAVLDRAEELLADGDTGTRGVMAASASLREVRSSIELLARLVVTDTPDDGGSANAALDALLMEAVGKLTMAELPPGTTRPVAVVDAELVE